jgi:hypothetical protein
MRRENADSFRRIGEITQSTFARLFALYAGRK